MFRGKWVPLGQSHLCVYQAQVGFSIEYTKIFSWKIVCVCVPTLCVKACFLVETLTHLSSGKWQWPHWPRSWAPPPRCCRAHLTTSGFDRNPPRTSHHPWDKAHLIDEALPSLFQLKAHHFQTHRLCSSNTGFFRVSCPCHVVSLLHSSTYTGASVRNATSLQECKHILPSPCSPTRPWT